MTDTAATVDEETEAPAPVRKATAEPSGPSSRHVNMGRSRGPLRLGGDQEQIVVVARLGTDRGSCSFRKFQSFRSCRTVCVVDVPVPQVVALVPDFSRGSDRGAETRIGMMPRAFRH